MCHGNHKCLLIISLLVNAFLGGFLISHIMGHGHFPPMMGHGGPGEFMHRALSELSPESRPKVEAILAKYKPDEFGPQKMGKHIEEMRKILTAPTFDRSAFEAAEKRMHAEEADMHKNISAMVGEIAKTLNDEERAKFFEKAFPPPPDMGRPPMDGHGKPPMGEPGEEK